MALIESTMLPLGTIAPSFNLLDVMSDQQVSLDDLRGKKGTVIMFICNHCPYVKHIQVELVRIAKRYQSRGIAFIGINSNDVDNYPEDSPEQMKVIAKKYQYPFPFLFDDTQAVAKAYQAACTPDFFLFNEQLACVYRGQLDGARPGNSIPVTGSDLTVALDNLLSGMPINEDQIPSVGCSIKWK